MYKFSPSKRGFYLIGFNKNIPKDAVDVDFEYHQYLIDGQSNGKQIGWDEKINKPVLYDFDEVSITKKFEQVRLALQQAIDIKAQEFGFSGGNALILYAGFLNPFQLLAQQFASWEVSVWVEANIYKDQVIAGTMPMLSPSEAVAMMPTYYG